MSIQLRAQFFYELSKLVESGISVARALDILARQWTGGPLARWAKEVREKLHGNFSVVDAFAAHPQARALETDLLRAGERGGRLGAVFSHLSAYYDRLGTAQSRVFRASLYPLVLVHLVILLGEVPRAYVSLDWSLGVSLGGKLLGLWAALLAVGFGTRALGELSGRVLAVDRVLSAIPVFGMARRGWVVARFASVCEIGLLAGLLMTETLLLAAAASGSAVVRSAAERAVSFLQSGSTLGEALEQAGGFPAALVASVSTAETAGSLDQEMKRVATLQWEAAERAVQGLEQWVPRLGYWMVLAWMAARILSQFAEYGKMMGAFSTGFEG